MGFMRALRKFKYPPRSSHLSLTLSNSAGVPQIVLPMWVDLFNYAQLAEQTGVGLWGCRSTTPDWTPQCLEESIVSVAFGPGSEKFRAKAREISVEAKRDGLGRDIAARRVAELARSGV
jgi:UDP:flavonoid glycosyltransferase YjiC (YdhE family)